VVTEDCGGPGVVEDCGGPAVNIVVEPIETRTRAKQNRAISVIGLSLWNGLSLALR